MCRVIAVKMFFLSRKMAISKLTFFTIGSRNQLLGCQRRDRSRAFSLQGANICFHFFDSCDKNLMGVFIFFDSCDKNLIVLSRQLLKCHSGSFLHAFALKKCCSVSFFNAIIKFFNHNNSLFNEFVCKLGFFRHE
jgi:hypothetical protein